jgi:hypothetical protein
MRDRKGITVVSLDYLNQYFTFLKGLACQLCDEDYDSAQQYYANSI